MSEVHEPSTAPEPQPEPAASRNGWLSTWLAMAALGLLLIGVASMMKNAEPPATARSQHTPAGAPSLFTPEVVNGQLKLMGKTEPAAGHSASIATMVIHPVVKVHVAAGDRVKAGQTIIELDRDEPEAEVRAHHAEVVQLKASLARLKAVPREQERDKARAELEAARATAKGAREHLARINSLLQKEAIAPGQELTARTESLNADADERAAAAYLEYLLKQPIVQEIAQLEAQIASAQAEAEACEAELEHYTLLAPIDGVVSWLKVNVGTVTRPGTAAWGEIVDLRELDVRVDVAAEQADRINTKQLANIWLPDVPNQIFVGRIGFIGPAADPQTGMVPVIMHIDNPLGLLRAHVNVAVQIGLNASP